ncbi:nuclear transport factor 2 family protein [Tsuneonella sp. YG55]|uniref:Nuclear transport factor 2 family protein n=1 Tax=Tsuneonella litorea TaxID=2976475 RepID=A0A9X2W2W7_9SPHN|nr:nuclear transport factor 2 family protein [Tsuneonella litorea]MCT2558970.1 nuclear transport factor 2 family protein [Tsuneonella litorea]
MTARRDLSSGIATVFRPVTVIATVTALMLPLAGCSQAASGDDDPAPAQRAVSNPDARSTKQQVLVAVHSAAAGFNARDAHKALAMFAPDLVSMFHGMPNGTLADERITTRTQVTDPAISLTLTDESVDVAEAGDMAVYAAKYRFGFTDPATGRPASETGNWVIVFRRQPDGTMKANKAIVSDLPEEG